MKVVSAIDNALTQLVRAALIVVFLLMLSLAVLEVALRFFFNYGIGWADIAARNLVMWVGFLGAALATREDKHFHIDILTRFLGKRQRVWFEALSSLFAAVICGFLGYASITFVQSESDAIAFLNVPTYVIELIVPIGFFIIMAQFILRAIIDFASGIKGEVLPDSLTE
ncbi:MAG TPA: TRAP transporter small permease subunit [Bacteroidota bacterium]|nr:TRAP transporter small permease subunit [Bacteroidota bacterium]